METHRAHRFAVNFMGTPFLETSTTSAYPNRLNWRCEMLLARHPEVVHAKRILDLASHDGRFSFACLKLGATHVTGIEGRPELVASSFDNMRRMGIPPERYEFLAGDMFDHLPTLQPGQFETILCLGFFYHTVRQVELLGHFRRLQPEHFILDTLVYRDRRAFKLLRFLKRVNLGHLQPVNFRALFKGLDGDSMVFFLEDHRLQSKTIDSSDLVAAPTRTALEKLVEAQGYKSAELDWHEDARDWSHLDDYRRGRRFSYICTRATLSS
jgi:hypothetical protein